MSYAKKRDDILSKIQKLKEVFLPSWAKVTPPDHLHLLDGGIKSLQDTETKARETDSFEVGLIGQSQIGKSTLLNALIGDEKYPIIFPKGGTGPLTALELAVRYGEKRRLEVTYHGADKLHQVVFGLRKKLEPKKESTVEIQIEKLEVDEDFKNSISQLKVLITGNQLAQRENEYLLKLTEALISKKKSADLGDIFSTFPDDKLNYEKVLKTISMDTRKANYSEDVENFLEAIKDHSAGCLSPLVSTLKMTWPAEILKNNVIISDLPGVGSISDSFPVETRKWLQTKCRSVILVVNNKGIDKDSTDLLRKADFFDRLRWSLDNPEEDPIQLIVAVTHMDSLVQDLKREDMPAALTKHCADMKINVITQLRKVLADSMSGLAEADVKNDRARIIERVIANVTIVPISAQQYISTLTGSWNAYFDKKDVEVTNLPFLRNQIINQAGIYFEEKGKRLDRGWDQCLQQINLSVDQLVSRLSSEIESDPVSEQITTEFMLFSTKLRQGLVARQAEFRKYRTKVVPEQIELLITQAQHDAQKTYIDYIRSELRDDAHWMSLKAVVTKGGEHKGSKKYINLPETVANMLSERIPTRFQAKIIKPMKEEAQDLIKSHSDSVVEAIDWIEKKKIPKTVRSEIENLKTQLELQSIAMNEDGAEALLNFKNAVKEELKTGIIESISSSLEVFRKSSAAKGNGVKVRMLDLFENAGTKALEDAKDDTTKMIVKKYDEIFNHMISNSLKIYNRDLVKDVQDIMEKSSIILAQAEREKKTKEITPKLKELSNMKNWIQEISGNINETKTS